MKSVATAILALTIVHFPYGYAGAQEQQGEHLDDLNWAQVRYVVAEITADGTWRFDATVEHNDEGWDHYADAWQVVDPREMQVIGERVLLHPHDSEQPFTRSLLGIEISVAMTRLIVRARCNKHGFGGKSILIDLTIDDGEFYEVRSQAARR